MPAEIKSVGTAPVSSPARAVVGAAPAVASAESAGGSERRREASKSGPRVRSRPSAGRRKTSSALVDRNAEYKKRLFIVLIALFGLFLVLVFTLGDRIPGLPFIRGPRKAPGTPDVIDIKEFQLK